MADWHAIGPEDMLAVGEMTEAEVGDQELLIARLEDGYHATQERCPHMRGHLARGTLDGSVVTCPRHGSRFDVTTGECVDWVEGLPGVVRTVAQAVSNPKDLATYPTRVTDGQVWVEV
jgi:3-phenylpropionate/trans-cinnamate dioxygenase ferredoxin subunit